MLKKAIIYLLLCGWSVAAWSAPKQSAATKSADKPKIDSVQLCYYDWCAAHKTDSMSLKKADTLFMLAGKERNYRMQAVAMCLKTDYYYYTNQLDSLRTWVARTREFAEQHDQPTHYFHVWTRLIFYYTKHSQYILAQHELQAFLEKAQQSDTKAAIAQSYKLLGQVYGLRRLNQASFDAFAKAAKYIKENNLDEPIYYIYTHMANQCLYLGDSTACEEASKYCKLAEENIQIRNQIWNVWATKADILIRMGRYGEAQRLLDQFSSKEAEGLYDVTRITEAQSTIYFRTGRHAKALALIDEIIKELEKPTRESDALAPELNVRDLYTYYRRRSECLSLMGQYREALEALQRSNELWYQLQTDASASTLAEFSTLLDVERLDREKVEAEQQAQIERLHRSRMTVVSLVFVTLLLSAFLIIVIRMNRQLARAKRAAEDANRMKSQFIRNITHEINTPLNAIVGFSELASDKTTEEAERTEYVDLVRENSDRLQKLVDDVLYIADLESTEKRPEPALADIHTMCCQAIHNANDKCESQSDIRFDTERESMEVATSSLLVVKVLNELLSNALHFAPGKPVTLDYSLSSDRRKLTFTVTDCGKGIAAADAERIFERFVKVDSFSNGLGLGLSVCRLIADTLGGNIHLDTSYTDGARFVFVVPIEGGGFRKALIHSDK